MNVQSLQNQYETQQEREREKEKRKTAIYGTMIALQTLEEIGCSGLCNSNGNFYLFSLVVIALIQLNFQSDM